MPPDLGGLIFCRWTPFFAIQTNLRDGPPAPHYSISVVGSHVFDTKNRLRRLFHTPIPYLLQGVKSPTFGLDFLRQSLSGDCTEQWLWLFANSSPNFLQGGGAKMRRSDFETEQHIGYQT